MECAHCRKQLTDGQDPHKRLTDRTSIPIVIDHKLSQKIVILEALLNMRLISQVSPLRKACLYNFCEKLLVILYTVDSAFRRFTLTPPFAKSIIISKGKYNEIKAGEWVHQLTQTDFDDKSAFLEDALVKVEVDTDFGNYGEAESGNDLDCNWENEESEGFDPTTTEKMQIVPITGTWFPEMEINQEPARNYQCYEAGCGKVFRSSYHSNRHQSVHTKKFRSRSSQIGILDDGSPNIPPFKCPTCGRCFHSRYHVNRHMNVHAKKKRVVATEDEQRREPDQGQDAHRSESEQGQGQHEKRTSTAGNRFLQKKTAIINYREMEHGVEKTRKSLASPKDENYFLDEEAEDYNAPKIKVTFLRSRSARSHRRTPRKEKEMSKEFHCPYTNCETQDSALFTSQGLIIHQIFHHGKKRRRQPADLNPKRKPRNQSLHEKKFVCTVDRCGKRFRDTRDLRVHSDTLLPPEERARPFPCPECGKTYRTSKAMQVHQVTHRDQRDFLCTECGKAYKTGCSLYLHMRSHGDRSSFSCGECGKGFNTRHALQSHSRVHSDLRPFICETCGLGFKSKLNLTKHMIIHSKKRTHTCPAPSCTSGFTHKYNLIQHIAGIHKLDREKVKLYLKDPTSEQLFG